MTEKQKSTKLAVSYKCYSSVHSVHEWGGEGRGLAVQSTAAKNYCCNSLRVQLEEVDYRPLDPKDIRLPPPMAPSERLLAAVDAFYTPPSRERPRDR